jgi:Mor family transcriptional regulator
MSGNANGVELLIDVKLQIAKLLLQRGYEDVSAIQIGEKVSADFHRHFAGSVIYLTKDAVAARHRRVLAMHESGSDIAEIVRSSRLSASHVYTIIRGARRQSGKENNVPVTDDGTSKLLKEMHFCITKTLARRNISTTDAYVMGDETVKFIYDRWQGVTWTLPQFMTRGKDSGPLHTRQERADKIFADHSNGKSFDELANLYSMGRDSVKWIVKRMSKKQRNTEQL